MSGIAGPSNGVRMGGNHPSPELVVINWRVVAIGSGRSSCGAASAAGDPAAGERGEVLTRHANDVAQSPVTLNPSSRFPRRDRPWRPRPIPGGSHPPAKAPWVFSLGG